MILSQVSPFYGKSLFSFLYLLCLLIYLFYLFVKSDSPDYIITADSSTSIFDPRLHIPKLSFSSDGNRKFLFYILIFLLELTNLGDLNI